MNKVCPKCSIDKPISDFYRRKTGPRSGEYYEKCKECMKFRGRSYYHANRDRQLQLALKRRHLSYLIKRKFLSNLKDCPCADCGKRYPFYVMDFDHRIPKEKINSVAYMVTRNWSFDKIKNEALKCEIVCANCHRIRTYNKLNLSKLR
jgi:hypothetical protein